MGMEVQHVQFAINHSLVENICTGIVIISVAQLLCNKVISRHERTSGRIWYVAIKPLPPHQKLLEIYCFYQSPPNPIKKASYRFFRFCTIVFLKAKLFYN